MVDIVVTPANVARSTGSIQRRTAGVAITAGDSVYVDSNGFLQLCQHDQTAVEAACAGIALNNAAANQPCSYQVSGDIDVGATLTVGEVYVVGSEPGGIAPVADPGTGDFTTVIGVASAAGNLKIGLNAAGVAQA